MAVIIIVKSLHSDHLHCCPENLPVCDVDAGRCLSSPGNMTGSVAWSLKEPALQTKTSWLNKLRMQGAVDQQ